RDEFIAEIGDGGVIYVPEDKRGDLSIVVDVRSGGRYSSSDVESYYLQLRGERSHNQTENHHPYAMFGDGSGDLNGRSFEYGEYNLRYRAYRRDNRSHQIINKRIYFELVGDAETETKTKTITSTCVWERNGEDAFNADAPQEGSYLAHMEAWFEEDPNHWDGGRWLTGHPLKRNNGSYRGTECRRFAPVELTNNRTRLENYINSLNAGGGTAGHQGIAWSWYLIAPEWKDIFSASAEPMAYDEPDAVKAVILMTDGEFNRQLYDSQGNSDQQARQLCDNLKEKDVVVYTVALQAPNRGRQILEYCASGPEFYFNAQNGEQLTDAYRAIATSLSDLRIKF
ncbi:MAG: VWA domain-containing protein, partial [Pseudomonadota bacterium]